MPDILEQVDVEIMKDITTQQEIYSNNVEFIRMLCKKYFTMGQKTSDESTMIADFQREFMHLLREVDTQAEAIESEEDAQLAALSTMKTDGPVKAELIGKFETLITDIDTKHSALVREVRNPKIKELFAKYLGM